MWQLLCKSQPSLPAVSYLFRSRWGSLSLIVKNGDHDTIFFHTHHVPVSQLHTTHTHVHTHTHMHAHTHISSVEQKATMVHLVRDSIQEQQKLFGTSSGASTPLLHAQASVAGSSSSTLSQPIRTKTNSKFSSLFTAYSTQTL